MSAARRATATVLAVACAVVMAACEATAPQTVGALSVEVVLAEAEAVESRSGSVRMGASPACIQPRLSVGAVTPTAPGINDLIRAEVLASAPATHWMYGRVEIVDSGGTTRKVWYVFGPGDSQARTAPAHYARGEATARRTVSFQIKSATAMRAVPDDAGIYRDGSPCFSTGTKTVRIAAPPPPVALYMRTHRWPSTAPTWPCLWSFSL